MLFKKLKIEKLQQQTIDSTSQPQQQQGSEGKLTVAKRIQSSLKVMKQSSLSELAAGTTLSFSSLDSLNSETVASGNREASDTASEQQEKRIPERLEGQGSLPSQLPTPVNDVNLLRNASTVSTSTQSQERPSITSVSDKQLSESPQRLAGVSAGRLSVPGSVVGKLARSLSECDRKALINELQLNNPPLPMSSSSDTEMGRANNPKQKKEVPSSISHPMCTSKQPVGTSDIPSAIIKPSYHKKHLQSDATTTKTQNQHVVITSTSSESGSPLVMEGKKAKIIKFAEEQALAEEQKALALLVERREAEEMVAQLSRERMNSMLTEEEIAEVCYPD